MVSGDGNDFAVGASTTLNCVVSNTTTLNLVLVGRTESYVWRRDGTMVGQQSSLTLDPLTTDDIGSYTCTVTISHSLLSSNIVRESEGLQINVVGKLNVTGVCRILATQTALTSIYGS